MALGLGLAGGFVGMAVLAVAIMAVRTRRRQMQYLDGAVGELHEQHAV